MSLLQEQVDVYKTRLSRVWKGEGVSMTLAGDLDAD